MPQQMIRTIRRGEAPMLRNSTTGHALRLHAMNVSVAVLGLLLLAPMVRAAEGNDGRTPDLNDCQNLQVPERNKVIFHVYAEGVQIYRWNGSSWIFVAPEAVLFADAGENGVVGVHYAGP